MQPGHSFTLKADGALDKILTGCWISALGVVWPPEGVNALILPGVRRYRALWDTGASNTCVARRVVQECSLERAGTAEILRRGGRYPSECYLITVGLESNVLFPVLAARAEDSSADVIIGMDIITKGDFAITNVDGKTVFSFRYPSLATLDFAADQNRREGTDR